MINAIDKMLIEIANMSNERQIEVFRELEKNLGADITNKLRERVCYIKLFTDKAFYNEVVKTMGARLYAEFNK